jgi:hypothetical protein
LLLLSKQIELYPLIKINRITAMSTKVAMVK